MIAVIDTRTELLDDDAIEAYRQHLLKHRRIADDRLVRGDHPKHVSLEEFASWRDSNLEAIDACDLALAGKLEARERVTRLVRLRAVVTSCLPRRLS